MDSGQEAIAEAVSFLGPRPRTEAEIRKRLTSKGFDTEIVDAALDHLRRRKFLDDVGLAKRMANVRLTEGPAKLQARMEARGLGEDAIETVLAGMDDQALATACDAALRKRRYKADERDKAVRYLVGRGFDLDTSLSAADRLWGPIDDD